jgi:hypothetical protein
MLCGDRTQAIEDEMHALFVCTGSRIVVLVREVFLAKVQADVPGCLDWHRGRPMGLFHELLQRQQIVPLLAKYVHEVMEVYRTNDVYVAQDVAQ